MPLTTITILDSISHVAITGASVFINGQGQSGTTDISGQFNLTLTADLFYGLSVKADGYSTFASNNLAGGKPFTAFIQPLAIAAPVSFTLNIIPEAAANGALISFSNGGTPVSTSYPFGGLTVQLISGPQFITGTIPNYEAINYATDTSTNLTGLIQLTALIDAGLKQPISAPIILAPTPEQLLPQTTPQDIPEFTPPNNGQGTYFTMTQARMYIGDLFIDELNYCQFVLQNNKIPIYGYASRDFDDMAQGKSLVQGQFGINFISEGYLFTALQRYSKLAGAGNVVDAAAATLQQSQARLLDLVNKLQNPDPTWTQAQFITAKGEINNLAASLGPAALQAAKAGITLAVKNQTNTILGLPGGDYDANATYNDIEFDIVILYTGAGRTITRRLEKCHLISNESIMDHSGVSIVDSYGFIARRLR